MGCTVVENKKQKATKQQTINISSEKGKTYTYPDIHIHIYQEQKAHTFNVWAG